MKRVYTRRFSCALFIIASMLSTAANAALTPVLPSPGKEPSLIGPGGILDRRFGIENLTRIDDSIDQFWNNQGTITVKTVAKWAGFSQDFGFIDADNEFTSLLNVKAHGHGPHASFSIEDSGEFFRFGLDPSGAPLWSSNSGENADSLDHMVTWQITSSHNKHLQGAYLIAWEDLSGGGDRDFNDLVVLVRNDVALAAVPVPAALWLFASGALGLAAVARRRRG